MIGEIEMEIKEKILSVMKEAGKPLSAGEVQEVTDIKLLCKAFKTPVTLFLWM